jgi:hypothetical protein
MRVISNLNVEECSLISVPIYTKLYRKYMYSPGASISILQSRYDSLDQPAEATVRIDVTQYPSGAVQ